MLMQGNQACAEGACTAGVTFFGGYPILPSTEVAKFSLNVCLRWVASLFRWKINCRLSARLSALQRGKSNDCYQQPRFFPKTGIDRLCDDFRSAFSHCQCTAVISTGQPTISSQGDVMQLVGARMVIMVIALGTCSVPECFSLMTIKAYELLKISLSCHFADGCVWVICASALNCGTLMMEIENRSAKCLQARPKAFTL